MDFFFYFWGVMFIGSLAGMAGYLVHLGFQVERLKSDAITRQIVREEIAAALNPEPAE